MDELMLLSCPCSDEIGALFLLGDGWVSFTREEYQMFSRIMPRYLSCFYLILKRDWCRFQLNYGGILQKW